MITHANAPATSATPPADSTFYTPDPMATSGADSTASSGGVSAAGANAEPDFDSGTPRATVGDLLENPRDYNGKTVSLHAVAIADSGSCYVGGLVHLYDTQGNQTNHAFTDADTNRLGVDFSAENSWYVTDGHAPNDPMQYHPFGGPTKSLHITPGIKVRLFDIVDITGTLDADIKTLHVTSFKVIGHKRPRSPG
jgi:hypothetical protein